jgi:hypothetical protein
MVAGLYLKKTATNSLSSTMDLNSSSVTSSMEARLRCVTSQARTAGTQELCNSQPTKDNSVNLRRKGDMSLSQKEGNRNIEIQPEGKWDRLLVFGP